LDSGILDARFQSPVLDLEHLQPVSVARDSIFNLGNLSSELMLDKFMNRIVKCQQMQCGIP